MLTQFSLTFVTLIKQTLVNGTLCYIISGELS